jgi:small-conductance mechanosensitive channel
LFSVGSGKKHNRKGKLRRRTSEVLLASGDTSVRTEARLETLTAVFRSIGTAFVWFLALFFTLEVLGISLGPLLATAGIVGVALGFGTQTMVRDFISGFFIVAEDQFGVGDTIDVGGGAKGVVERITLRTVALRHHNGPLHFVPYGSLGTVRNNSRDWVIEKFILPLPIEVDSETVRKLIKKVGESAKKVGGHGGMDHVMNYRMLDCLRQGITPDMTVYDAADWSSILEISVRSVKDGSMPIQCPDFTRGGWKTIKPLGIVS